MAMQGLSNADIRYDVTTRLRADTGITASVPADRIYDSRAVPVDANNAIIVYIHSEAYDFGGTGAGGPSDFPQYLVATELAIELYVSAASDDAVEGTLDLEQDVLTCLLNDPVFMRQFWRVQSINVARDLQARGAKRVGVARIILSLVHQRAWGT